MVYSSQGKLQPLHRSLVERRERFVFLALTLFLHIFGLLPLFDVSPPVGRESSITKSWSTLVFVATPRSKRPGSAADRNHREAITPPAIYVPMPQMARVDSTDAESIQPPPIERGPETSEPQIDWREEGRRIAAAQLEDSLHAYRHLGGITAPSDSQPLARSEFGWSKTAIQPVQMLEGGGVVIWINDRCAIVISMLAMPMCKLGKIEARADLFEHMGDAESGDFTRP